MILSLLSKQRRQEFKLLIYLSLFAFLIVALRLVLPSHRSLGFLIYNLCLAYIPLIVSTFIRFYIIRKKLGIWNWILVFVWIIFFPNAPYILTDGIHVMGVDSPLIVLDILIWVYIMIIAFWIAILSIGDIESIIRRHFSHWVFIQVCIVSIVLISAYGIYLGRDLRLNSWDIILKPFLLLENIYQTFVNSSPGFFNWSAVFLYSLIIYSGYLISLVFKRRKK